MEGICLAVAARALLALKTVCPSRYYMKSVYLDPLRHVCLNVSQWSEGDGEVRGMGASIKFTIYTVLCYVNHGYLDMIASNSFVNYKCFVYEADSICLWVTTWQQGCVHVCVHACVCTQVCTCLHVSGCIWIVTVIWWCSLGCIVDIYIYIYIFLPIWFLRDGQCLCHCKFPLASLTVYVDYGYSHWSWIITTIKKLPSCARNYVASLTSSFHFFWGRALASYHNSDTIILK